MEKIGLYLLVCFAFFAWSCDSTSPDCLKKKGNNMNEYRIFEEDIEVIELHDAVELFLFVDPSQKNKVHVFAPTNEFQKITTHLENGRLIIKDENACKWMRSYEKNKVVHVYLTNPPEEFIQYGFGYVNINLRSLDTINSFKMRMFGVSEAFLFFNKANYVEIEAEKSGVLNVYGNTNSSLVILKNQFRFNGRAFYVEDLRIDHQSESEATLNVSNSINATLSNNGDVVVYTYKKLEEVIYKKGKGGVVYRDY